MIRYQRYITNIILILALNVHVTMADEILSGFDRDKDLPILNDELRQINESLSNHNHDSSYLSKTNTTAFTPTGDYQPATKKYVDDNIGGTSSQCWVSLTWNGSAWVISDSYNVDSIVSTDNAHVTINWDTDFGDAYYAAVCTVIDTGGSNGVATITAQAAGSITVRMTDPSTDGSPTGLNVVAFGNQ